MSQNKIAVVVLAGGEIQHKAIWPSYYNCLPGLNHDLIVVHRNKLNLPDNIYNNSKGNVVFLNKIINNVDVPHRAFGGYRYAFNTYKDHYDYFIFISDDVVIRRDNWLKSIIDTLDVHEKLGFGGSQIFNGHKKYPHESHIRAPFWFAKTNALKDTKWEFNSDHDGEMKIGNQITNAGYFGVQVGNKIDLAYDSFELNHITQILEKTFFPKKNLFDKFKMEEINFFYKNYFNLNVDERLNSFIHSPYQHINKQNIYIDIEPLNGLIYLPSLEIAKKYVNVVNLKNDIYII